MGMPPPGSARPKGPAPEWKMSVSSPVSPREIRRASALAQRRQDALAAASEIFASKGFHDAQMTEIAAAAELSRASLYSMFTGKEELYQEVISTAAQAVRDAVHEKVEALDDPGHQLLLRDRLPLLLLRAEPGPAPHLRARHTRAALQGPAGDGRLRAEIFAAFTEWVIEIAKRAKRAGYLQRLDPEAVGLSLVGAVSEHRGALDRNDARAAALAGRPPVHAIFQQLLGTRGKS